jgi:hypothetical protein
MKEKKYAKYVTKMVRPPGFQHDAKKGKATIGPPSYDKKLTGCEEAPIHIEHFQINKADCGFALNTLMGPVDGKMILDVPHRHLSEELFMFTGSNMDNPDQLGAEIEYWLGEGQDAEQFIITDPTVVLVPAGTVHCPIYFRKVDKPPVFMTVIGLAPIWYREDSKEFPPNFKLPKQHSEIKIEKHK